MKKIIKFIGIGWILLIFLSGCTKLQDVNINPDKPTQASASMLCTNVVLQFAKFQSDAKAYITQDALSKYVGYADEGQLNEQYNLITNGSFGSMVILTNIQKMLDAAKGSVMESSYQGVAKFAEAYTFYRLTMEMGDIPFTEAGKGEQGLFQPKYDTQESVLLGVLNDLKEADQDFANGQPFTGDPSNFNGDPVKWRQATNAFALEVLMSLSDQTGDANLDVKNRFATIVSAGNLMQPSTDYFGLIYSAQDLHPLSGTNDLFTSRTILSSLLVDNLKKLDDRRLFYFGEPAYAKISAGATQSDTAAYVGVDVSMSYPGMNAGWSAGEYSLLNLRYLQQAACEPRRLITYAEQQLILAEASIRGWITTGTAQNYYEDGVKAALADVMACDGSYAHGMPITQSYIDNYFTGEAAFKTNPTDELHQIWMQRYLLNFMQMAEGSWFEYRRNSYPDFPINPATSLNATDVNAIPMRYLYPASESDYNRANLTEALNRQFDGYDDINKIMWVLKSH
ncbi:MAG: SusD/RagB family nutrient-binding outer membrane lipoprotein [Bacteroidales bacterium]|nr:SusD/RagB family nutrient-binding outer membrane lipoprotein [Bacteroidales bacterium]